MCLRNDSNFVKLTSVPSQTYDSLTTADKNICESYECHNGATLKIRINVGKFGEITLDLCKYCVPKFKGTVIGDSRQR